jgi:hypothetical protein
MSEKATLYWNLYTELRKEIIESQKIRAQVVSFKITFVSAAIGLLASHLDTIPKTVLIIPAFASVFFDFLINSYSFSIKRIGYYLKQYVEPELKTEYQVTDDFLFWQHFLKNPKTGQFLSQIGNYGITLLASCTGIFALFFPYKKYLSPLLILLLALFLFFDYKSFRTSRVFYFEGPDAPPVKNDSTGIKQLYSQSIREPRS